MDYRKVSFTMATGVHYTTELLDLPSSFCGECCNLEHALLRLEWTLLELETVGSCMELSYYTPSVACRAHWSNSLVFKAVLIQYAAKIARKSKIHNTSGDTVLFQDVGLLALVSWASPIPFCSTNRFQYQLADTESNRCCTVTTDFIPSYLIAVVHAVFHTCTLHCISGLVRFSSLWFKHLPPDPAVWRSLQGTHVRDATSATALWCATRAR